MTQNSEQSTIRSIARVNLAIPSGSLLLGTSLRLVHLIEFAPCMGLAIYTGQAVLADHFI